MTNVTIADIADAYKEHHERKFPRSARGRDVNGVDLVMFDADIAGCANYFIKNGTLDVRRTAILGKLAVKWEGMFPVLNDECCEYFGELAFIAIEILTYLSRELPFE